MSIDLGAILKDFGGQIFAQAKTNLGDLVKNLNETDLRIIERATQRKAELLVAKVIQPDIDTSYDELKIDETLALLADKAAAIVQDTVKKTVLEVIETAGKIVLKLAFGAIGL